MTKLKVAVIGATGGTGKTVVENAIAAGYEVIAVARRPEAVKIHSERLDIRRGDAHEFGSICQAISGADAIISAIGSGRAKEPTQFYSKAIRNIISAMRETNARRLICIGASGYIDAPGHPLWMRLMMENVVRKLLHHSYEDMIRMEEIIKDSDLDWTIIRPPRLTNGRRTEFYRVQEEVVIGGAKISRADVADYIVKNLNDSRTFSAAFGVAY
ncbi:MAG: SDR family oxidoreductase [Acidobacteriota bacterium]